MQFEVEAYLRLSGLYQRIFAGGSPSASELARDYAHAFTRPSHNVTYIAPIQFVTFASDFVDCGGFHLRRFRRDELDQMLQNDARRLFYPWAYVDTKELAEYWFVCVKQERPRKRLGYGELRFSMGWNHSASSPHFPDALESALRRLPLYDWGKVESDRKPGIVGVLSISGRSF